MKGRAEDEGEDRGGQGKKWRTGDEGEDRG